MTKALNQQKKMVEQILLEDYQPIGSMSWGNEAHPILKFSINDFKLAYSIDSTPKSQYSIEKTRRAMKNALIRKSLQWKYIKDPSEFQTKFMKEK